MGNIINSFRFGSSPPSSTYPAYVDSGTFAESGSANFIDVSYPTTVNASDILILTVMQASDVIFTTPTDVSWEVIGTATSTDASYVSYWVRASGSESGTVTVNTDTSLPIWGTIERFSDCITTGTPYEGYSAVAWANNNSQNLSLGLASQDLSLACIWYIQESNQTVTNNSVGYTQEYLKYSSIASKATFAFHTEELATSSTADGSVEYSHADRWNALFGIILIPN